MLATKEILVTVRYAYEREAMRKVCEEYGAGFLYEEQDGRETVYRIINLDHSLGMMVNFFQALERAFAD